MKSKSSPDTPKPPRLRVGLKDVSREEFAAAAQAQLGGHSVAELLRFKAELMHALTDYLTAQGWRPAEAAARCGVTETRIQALFQGDIDQFTIEALLAMLIATGQRVHITLETAA